MSDTTIPDKVHMEFQGPVPGIQGQRRGYHVLFWVQAAGGAGFTHPTPEERDFYEANGKPVPEWQCEYFEFDGLTWPEAAITVELWCGSAKLRSHCVAGRAGRKEAELRVELPDLDDFIQKHNLASYDVTRGFHDALLRAAATAGVIQLGVTGEGGRAKSSRHGVRAEGSWWRRALRSALPRLRAA